MNDTRRRPRLVTVASGVLATGGALFGGEVLLSADAYFTGMGVYDQASSEGLVSGSAFAAVGVVLHLAMTAVGVFTGAVLVVLAVFVGAGQSWARAVSWILALPVLIWYSALALLTVVGGFLAGDTGSSDPPELLRRYEQAWPSWLGTLDVVLMVLASVALLAALVCLTVPAADAWFRTRSARRRPVAP